MLVYTLVDSIHIDEKLPQDSVSPASELNSSAAFHTIDQVAGYQNLMALSRARRIICVKEF